MRKSILLALMAVAWLSGFARMVHANQVQHDLLVINHEWYKSAGSSAFLCATFQASSESPIELREHDGMLCSDGRTPDAHSPCPCHSEVLENHGDSKRVADEYTYTVRVRNIGQKAISAIVWDYVFIDPLTARELARHAFSKESQLLPGKTKTVIATSAKPPTRVISARMLFNNWEGNYVERIEIKSIKYADGSVWKTN